MKLTVYSIILILYYVPVQATDYDFSSFCYRPGYPKNYTITTLSSGSGNITQTYSKYIYLNNGLDCTIQLNPPVLHGIVLSVVNINLRELSSTCLDTVEIYSLFASGGWYNEMPSRCQQRYATEYKDYGPMFINFKTSNKSLVSSYGKSFTIVYTTYSKAPCYGSNYFQCTADDMCIPKNLMCNGIKNCRDGSDERSTECNRYRPTPTTSYYRGTGTGAIIGGIVGGVIFLIIVASIATFLCRRDQILRRTTTTIPAMQTTTVYPHGAYPEQRYVNPQDAYPQQGYAVQPPYSQQPVQPQTQYYTQPQPYLNPQPAESANTKY